MKTENVNVRLRRLREQNKLSAKDMAQRIGVAQSTYVDWENGKGLKLPPLQKISQVLAISVTELITGEKPTLGPITDELARIESLLHEVRSQLSSFI